MFKRRIIKNAPPCAFSEDENKAIDAALKASESGQTYTHNKGMNEAKQEFSYLKFKCGT